MTSCLTAMGTIILIFLGWSFHKCTTTRVTRKEYCSTDTFNVTCPSNHVIIMRYALYGRMQFGRCMQEDHGHTGCYADVLPTMDQKCSGLRHCEVGMPLAGVTVPQCPNELLKFLEADYRCQKALPTQQCGRHKKLSVRATNETSYLTPPKIFHNYLGTKNCPWVISTEPGRQINLTVLNFNIMSTQSSGQKSGSQFSDLCQVAIMIKDHNKTVEKLVCQDNRRESLSYVSLSHSISVYTLARTSMAQPGRFLLSYTAVGCPDMKHLAHAWVQRQGDTLKVKCNYTGETFFLSCTGTRWLGELHNCTGGPNFTPYQNGRASQFPYGLLIVIGIGVALGVALGIILLAGILTCFKRRKEQQIALSHHTSDPLLSEVTRETDIDSNYYERRFQALATIGRGSRMGREPIYNDRSLSSQISSSPQQRFSTLPPGSRTPGIYRQMSAPPPPTGSLTIQRKALSESPYCSCVQPAPTHGPGNTTMSTTNNTTTQQQNSASFVTFKPSGDLSPCQSLENSPTRSLTGVGSGRSLDLLKDPSNGSPDLLKDSDLTKIHHRNDCMDAACICNPPPPPSISKHAPINNNSINQMQYPKSACSNSSSNNKSI